MIKVSRVSEANGENGILLNHEFCTRFLLLFVYNSSQGWEYLISPRSKDQLPIPETFIREVFESENGDPPNCVGQGFTTYYNAYIGCILKASELEGKIIDKINGN